MHEVEAAAAAVGVRTGAGLAQSVIASATQGSKLVGEASIPVDLANPGQVFACLGFVETADVLLGEVQGGFDWSDGGASRFRLAADGDENPIESVLRFLDRASVTSAAPDGSSNVTDRWGIETVTDASGAFPFGDPPSPATLPARLEDATGRAVTIDYWGDQTERDNVKFWGGSGGYPGAALARDALKLIDGRAADQAAGSVFTQRRAEQQLPPRLAPRLRASRRWASRPTPTTIS